MTHKKSSSAISFVVCTALLVTYISYESLNLKGQSTSKVLDIDLLMQPSFERQGGTVGRGDFSMPSGRP